MSSTVFLWGTSAVADVELGEVTMTPMPRLKGGWKTPPNPAYHPCLLPIMEYQDAGRPWECPDCAATWTLYRDATIYERLAQYTADKQEPLQEPPQAQPQQESMSFPGDPGFYEPLAEPGDGSISKVKDHSPSCAFRLGTGMCSCDQRKTI